MLISSPAFADCDMTQPHKYIDSDCINLTQSEIDANAAAAIAAAPIIAAQQAATVAQAAIASGISITSTGTPALNGTYSLSSASLSNVNAITTYILLNGTFPGGESTLPYPDSSGAMHIFPSVAAFKAFATVVANFVAAIELYANSGGTVGSIPSNQVTIP